VRELPHKIFTVFLITIGSLTALTIWARNYTYYLLPLDERPVYQRYDELKPEGIESHGYGIIGTAIIFIGVSTYSARKRLRKFAHFGKIRDYLDFHIFMCLVGPILVMYHTTFKFGGIAGAGFWCMTAVVLSGFVGRYFYRFIPKNIEGQEFSVKELEEERQKLLLALKAQYNLDDEVLKSIESIGGSGTGDPNAGFMRLFWYMLKVDFSHRRYTRELRKILRKHSVPSQHIKKIARVASQRLVLRQRILVLEKIRLVFHYWHVIHLPFSLIVLVILIIHVGVAVAFGYTWIW